MNEEAKIGICIVSLFVIAMVICIIDSNFLRPIADDKANAYCQQAGFDQYKSYSRYGFFSTEPIGIKCEYAEKYTDLGVRTTKS